MSIRGKTAIAGIGYTAQGRVPGRTALSLYMEASRNALTDAGMRATDIDGIIIQPCPTDHSISFGSLAQELGIALRFGADQQAHGASAATIIQHAAMAVHTGLSQAVLCAFADTSQSAPLRGSVVYQRALGTDAAYGLFGVASGYALAARRHIEEYGTTSRQLGAVAVAFRKHAALNPRAQMREPITMEDHQASRLVVEPFHLLDMCLVSDGGRAFIVTSEEKARSLRQPPVYILGFGQGHPVDSLLRRPSLTTTGAVHSGRLAFEMAGVTPADVDVALIYDAFTSAVIIQLEDLRFCAKGEGGPFVEDGRLELGGPLPTNTSGGLLSEVYLQGWVGPHEAVLQLRKQAGERQVRDAELAVVTGSGGVLSTHGTIILGDKR